MCSESIIETYALVAEELGDELGELGQLVVVKGTGREGDAADLVDEGLNNARVLVALVNGGVAREEVVVLLAIGVAVDVQSFEGRLQCSVRE